MTDDLTPDEMTTALTGWVNDTRWYPFIENESAIVCGPGHQSPDIFANQLFEYDVVVAGEAVMTKDQDVSHEYAYVYVKEGDIMVAFIPKASPLKTIPVTVVRR